METSVCDINHLDSHVLLPPRKRLLAGFKKQNSDGDGASLRPNIVPSSSSSASPSSPFPRSPSPSPPSPAPHSPSPSEFQIRLDNLLGYHFHNHRNLSPEQIVEASKSAANAAVKAAEAARAAAQAKALVAARAMAAAKNALALVESYPEEMPDEERYPIRNRMKKHVQVQLLYNKHQPTENYTGDEELARKLHRVINSSPRISKHSQSSDVRGQKSKWLKSSSAYERTRVDNGSTMLGENPPSMSNGHGVLGDVYTEDSMPDGVMGNGKTASKLDMDDAEAESSQSKDRVVGDAGSPIKKRGRLKLKTLPLSICNSRDQTNPKEGISSKSSPLTDRNMGNPTARSKPPLPMEPTACSLMPIEAAPIWKCQDFKAQACVKQNKVMQS